MSKAVEEKMQIAASGLLCCDCNKPGLLLWNSRFTPKHEGKCLRLDVLVQCFNCRAYFDLVVRGGDGLDKLRGWGSEMGFKYRANRRRVVA